MKMESAVGRQSMDARYVTLLYVRKAPVGMSIMAVVVSISVARLTDDGSGHVRQDATSDSGRGDKEVRSTSLVITLLVKSYVPTLGRESRHLNRYIYIQKNPALHHRHQTTTYSL